MIDTCNNVCCSISKLLEHSSFVIRGKALLSVCLLGCIDLELLVLCGGHVKLSAVIDRTAKEGLIHVYLRQCLQVSHAMNSYVSSS